MDESRKNLLDLDDSFLLRIMQYIIADCELNEEAPDNPLKYEDIINVAKAHDHLEELLKTSYKEIYYHREMTLLAQSLDVTINFKNERDAYWKLCAKVISKNTAMRSTELNLDPAFLYPDFHKHFRMIMCALEKKRFLSFVSLTLKGYYLHNLDHFCCTTDLYLDVRMSAEVLVSFCKSSPKLDTLTFMSTELQGRLSDIVPHCRNLKFLKFAPKPDVDASEYAPLALLPKLEKMTIHGVYKNGSLLRLFKAIQKWRRTETKPLNVIFSYELPAFSSVTVAITSSLRMLSSEPKKNPKENPPRIELAATYDFFEISKDTSPLEQSLATITLTTSSLIMDFQNRTFYLWECQTSDIEISVLVSILKVFHLNNMSFTTKQVRNGKYPPLAKLLGSMVPDGLFALQSLRIHGLLDKSDTLGLVKIISIKSLFCSFSDWECIGLLSECTNLNTVHISVETEFEKTHSKALCNLLNTSQVSGTIRCKSWQIDYTKNNKMLGEANAVKFLRIGHHSIKESLNELFEAFANRDLITIEEVYITNLKKIHFKDILKVTKVQTIRKLEIAQLADTNGIEKLSELTRLEKLTISETEKGSLIKLFDQLAMMEAPSLQCLSSRGLSPEELFKVSRIKSLKKLELWNANQISRDNVSLTELANSNLEELTVEYPEYPERKLLAAFAAKPTNRLQHLNIMYTLDLIELEELSKLKGLKSFHTTHFDTRNVEFLQKLENLENLNVQYLCVNLLFMLPVLKKLVIRSPIDLKKCRCLAGLENLESLTLPLIYEDEVESDHYRSDVDGALDNIIGRKKLIINLNGSPLRMYQALASKSRLKHLTAPIRIIEELVEVTRIKSLEELHLYFYLFFPFKSDFENNSELGKLKKLKSLHITKKCTWAEHKLGIEFVHLILIILKACRNLDFFVIKYLFEVYGNFVRDVHNVLKSIRDPACQRPLILILQDGDRFESDVLSYPPIYIDDDYLKVYYKQPLNADS